MTSALSAIEIPHWLIMAGSLLVALGLVGLSLRRESYPVEPDAIAGERKVFELEGDLAQADDPSETKTRRDRWAERRLEMKDAPNNGPEFYGKRSG
jgi:hypothetical protein